MKIVSITMPEASWEELSSSLSDVLCWSAGFLAASKDCYTGLIGLEELRSFNLRIKSNLSSAQALQEPAPSTSLYKVLQPKRTYKKTPRGFKKWTKEELALLAAGKRVPGRTKDAISSKKYFVDLANKSKKRAAI